MKKARVINNIVQETFIVPNGVQFIDCFTAEVVEMFEDVAEEVEAGLDVTLNTNTATTKAIASAPAKARIDNLIRAPTSVSAPRSRGYWPGLNSSRPVSIVPRTAQPHKHSDNSSLSNSW